MEGNGNSAKIYIAQTEKDLTVEKALELNAIEFGFLQKSINASGAGTQSKTGFIIEGSMQISAGNDKFINFFNYIIKAENKKEFWIGKITEVGSKNTVKKLSYKIKYTNVVCVGYSLTCDSYCRITCDISFSCTNTNTTIQANSSGGSAELGMGNIVKK